MYVAGFVIPVPEDRKDDYIVWARRGAALFREFGCLEVVESWEDTVPDGKTTDFRKAVDARPGERIVFTWQVWPDRETLAAAEARMRDDPRFELPADMPFDARRLILGTFEPLIAEGRGQ